MADQQSSGAEARDPLAGPSPRDIVRPDYTRSLLNLSASLLCSFGLPCAHPALAACDPLWLRSKKNIVLLVFDGLGARLLAGRAGPSEGFFRAHLRETLTSVYPSTTTSAITSLLTGKSPLEHGALGWTLFFKEHYRFIELLPLTDHASEGPLPPPASRIHEEMRFEPIFPSIRRAEPAIALFYLTPRRIAGSSFTRTLSTPAQVIGADSPGEQVERIHELLAANRPGRSFVYGYLGEPDGAIHVHGAEHESVERIVTEIQDGLERLTEPGKLRDTALLVTADHGLLTMDEYISLESREELFSTLVLPPLPEPRFVTFFVKPHRHEAFLRAAEVLGEHFLLLSREQFLGQGFLGGGRAHPRLDDFLGDHVALATGRKGIFTEPRRDKPYFVPGMHGGLCAEEMLIPLLTFDL